MDRSIVVMASLAGTAFTVLTWTGYRVHAADRATLQDLERRLEMRSEAPSEPIRASDGEDAHPLAELEEAVQELALRMNRLEHVSQRTPIPDRSQPPESRLESEQAEPLARGAEPDAALRLEFEQCLAQLIESGWDFSGSREGFERFLALTRETGLLDEKIADLEAHVAADPDDVAGRMALADTYVGKLMTVSGPEQGLWGGRAEEQWLAAVDLDDGHWAAHSSLGTTYSYYPEVMGKAGDAIRHLERAREIQRTLQPAPEHVQTYLFLAQMYKGDGSVDAARDVLIEGLQHHPGDPALEAALGEVD